MIHVNGARTCPWLAVMLWSRSRSPSAFFRTMTARMYCTSSLLFARGFFFVTQSASTKYCVAWTHVQSRAWSQKTEMGMGQTLVPRRYPKIGVNGWLPSGELTFCHGKSPFSMGKSTISMAIYTIAMLVHQRVFHHSW